jgi:hypothetical protein
VLSAVTVGPDLQAFFGGFEVGAVAFGSLLALVVGIAAVRKFLSV